MIEVPEFWYRRVQRSDGKFEIIVAPEYNGVMPPVLNNAMAWTSRATKNWRDAFDDKDVLVDPKNKERLNKLLDGYLNYAKNLSKK